MIKPVKAQRQQDPNKHLHQTGKKLDFVIRANPHKKASSKYLPYTRVESATPLPSAKALESSSAFDDHPARGSPTDGCPEGWA